MKCNWHDCKCEAYSKWRLVLKVNKRQHCTMCFYCRQHHDKVKAIKHNDSHEWVFIGLVEDEMMPWEPDEM